MSFEKPAKKARKKKRTAPRAKVIARTSDPAASPAVWTEEDLHGALASKPEPNPTDIKTDTQTPFDWVELFPQGISVTTNLARPVLILKDKTGSQVLPVWMDAIDAGVAIAEGTEGSGASPHAVTRKIMDAFGWKLEACVFVDLIGHHQFVHVGFSGVVAGADAPKKTVRLRAGEAMSFCLQGGARFFATKAYMARCRDLNVDLLKFESTLVHGQGHDISLEKKNPYLM